MEVTDDRRLHLLALLGVATVLRGFYLSTPALTDEAITVAFSWEFSTAEMVTKLPLLQPHPPLYYLIADAVTVLGGGVVALRWLSVVAGVATVGAVYHLGVGRHSHRAGLFAAALVSISPLHIGVSRLARMYALVGLLTMVSWWALYRLQRRPSWPRVAAYAAATVALVWTHYFGLFIVGSQVAWIGMRTWRREASAAEWKALVTVGAGAAPLLRYLVPLAVGGSGGGGGPGSIIGLPQPGPVMLVRTVGSLVVGWDIATITLANPATAIGLGGVVLWGGGIARSGMDISLPTDEPLWFWAVVPVVIAIAVSATVRPIFRPRYAVGAALAAYLLLGTALADAWETPDGRQLAAGLLIVMAVTAPLQYHGAGQGWSPALGAVEEQADADDQVVIVGAFERSRHYWLRAEGFGQPIADQSLRPSEIYVDADGETVWVVRKWSQRWGFDERLANERMGLEDYEVATQQRYQSIIVYRLERSPVYKTTPYR